MPKTPITDDTPILSEPAKVKRMLDEDEHDRWGFTIYRCTYGDDAAWNQFKETITSLAQKEIQDSDKPEILDALDWKFFDDRKLFDKATAAFLREHFNHWNSNNAQREQPRATYPLRAPRYEYFIRVDQEALDSVIHDPVSRDGITRPRKAGWVHFIEAGWIADLDQVGSDTESIDMPNLEFESVEGCREEDVGWMKVLADSIFTELYTLFDGPELWRYLYRRPPEMATM